MYVLSRSGLDLADTKTSFLRYILSVEFGGKPACIVLEITLRPLCSKPGQKFKTRSGVPQHYQTAQMDLLVPANNLLLVLPGSYTLSGNLQEIRRSQ